MLTSMGKVQDSVVWITGASSGIGTELALAFARRKCKLVLSGRKIDALQTVADQAQLLGAPHVWVKPFDGTDFSAIPSLGAQIWEETGGVDILINNAGISQRSLTAETDLSVDQSIMNINYFAAVALTKSILHQMIEKGNGHVVMMSSVVGYFGYYQRSAYAASKHALHGFTDSLWAECSNQGIKTLLVTPGGVRTNISLNALNGKGEQFGKLDNLQAKGMEPDWVANKVIQAIESNKRELLLAQKERILVVLRRFFPTIFFWIIPKVRR
jgi:dehydrogenase/reductase SDR family protein 7B